MVKNLACTAVFTRTQVHMAAVGDFSCASYSAVHVHGKMGHAVLFSEVGEATFVVLKRVSGGFQMLLEAGALGALAQSAVHIPTPTLITPSAFVVQTQRDGNGTPVVWAELPKLSASMQHIVQMPDISVHDSDVAHLLCYDLVSAVSALHARGIVHCDIKLSNTALCPTTGRLMLLDFDSVSDQACAGVQELPMCTLTTRPPEWDDDKLRLRSAGGYRPALMYAGDVYSTAMCVAELLVGKHLHTQRRLTSVRTAQENNDFAYSMRHGALLMARDPERRSQIPTVAAEAWQALAFALSLDPAMRCSASELEAAFAKGLSAAENTAQGVRTVATRREIIQIVAQSNPASLHTDAHANKNVQSADPAQFKRHPVPSAPLSQTIDASCILFAPVTHFVCSWASNTARTMYTTPASERLVRTCKRVELYRDGWYRVRCALNALRAVSALQDATGVPDATDVDACGGSENLYTMSDALLLAAVRQGAHQAFVGVQDNAVLHAMHLLQFSALPKCVHTVVAARFVYTLASLKGVQHCVEAPRQVARTLCTPLEQSICDTAAYSYLMHGVHAVHGDDAAAHAAAMQATGLQPSPELGVGRTDIIFM